jgi:hypothetical protein
MFWFGRPSYWRWAGAALLIFGAMVIELWPSRQVPYPFAAQAVEAGDPIVVEWRTMPAGLYLPPDVAGGVAAHPVAAGDPIRESDLAPPITPPRDWWALSLEVPLRLAPGTPTRLVIAGSTGEPVPGVVVTSSDPDRFSASGPTALIAVPEAEAAAVAAAAAARQVVVLIAP